MWTHCPEKTKQKKRHFSLVSLKQEHWGCLSLPLNRMSPQHNGMSIHCTEVRARTRPRLRSLIFWHYTQLQAWAGEHPPHRAPNWACTVQRDTVLSPRGGRVKGLSSWLQLFWVFPRGSSKDIFDPALSGYEDVTTAKSHRKQMVVTERGEKRPET